MSKNHHHHSDHDHSHDDHDHSHHRHGHSHALPDKINNAFIIAITANLVFTILQFVYSYLANSTSLLADAGHNFGDVLGLAFAWIANLLLKKKSSDKMSYGFKKSTILAALSNALLLVLACVLIAVEAVEHLIHEQTINAMNVMVIASIGILVNGGTALLFMKGQEDLNIKSAFMHLAYDALISLGVVIAAIIIYFTGWHIIDPIVGLIITVTIFWGAWGLLRDSVQLVMDAVPSHIDIEAVRNYLANITSVTEVHDLHIWGMSTSENALTAHLVIPNGLLSDEEREKINHDLLEKFKIHHSTIQIEQGNGSVNCAHTSCAN